MSLLRPIKRINWKYIVGEVLLIFLGINLAIWFNDWSATQKITRQRSIAIDKIKEEIRNNVDELTDAQAINKKITEAYADYAEVYGDNSAELITTPENLQKLQAKHPGYFQATDSILLEPGLYHYKGGSIVFFEIAELTQIAWETAKSVDVSHSFNYECLYQLESTYSLQRRVAKEFDKAADPLQKRDLEQFIIILDVIEQYAVVLEELYAKLLQDIDRCR